MTAAVTAKIVYRIGKTRLLKSLVIACVFVAVSILDLKFADPPPAGRFLLYLSAGFFGLLGLLFVLQLLSSQPGLILDSQGIEVPRRVLGKIFWSDIVDIRRTKMKRSDSLALVLTPEAARNLRLRRWARLFGSNPKSIGVNLSLLDDLPDYIAAEVLDRWSAARLAIGASPALPARPPAAAMPLARSRVTYGLLALLALVYAAELYFSVNPNLHGAPTVLTLAYDGGLIGSRIEHNGEWWRLFTAPLMHANPTHIVLNGIVLWFSGRTLEKLVGWRWLIGLFAISGICGALASLAFLPPYIVGVGASGAIMGLLAATFVISFRLPPGGPRTAIQIRMMQMIVPSILPFFNNAKGMHVDYFAHGGGAFGGAVVALILLKVWRSDQTEPPFAHAAVLAGAAFFLIAVGALVPIAHLRAEM